MGIKLQNSQQVIISAKADPAHPFTMRWISKQTKDWVIANVKISDIDDSRPGEKSVRILITFDAVICEPCETTS